MQEQNVTIIRKLIIKRETVLSFLCMDAYNAMNYHNISLVFQISDSANLTSEMKKI